MPMTRAVSMLTLQSPSMLLEDTPIALVIRGMVRMSFRLDDSTPLAGLVLGDEHDVVGDVLERM